LEETLLIKDHNCLKVFYQITPTLTWLRSSDSLSKYLKRGFFLVFIL